MCNSRIFWKKSSSGKNDKNSQKWPKNRIFGLLKKIMSLVLSGICVKRKFLWFIKLCENWMLGKNLVKSGSQVIAKNRLYLINRLIFDFDFSVCR